MTNSDGTKTTTSSKFISNGDGKVTFEAKGTDYNEYIRGDRVLLKKKPGSNSLQYYLYNGHGDVIGLLYDNGTIANTYDYDEFGNLTTQQEKTYNPFKYAGEYLDAESGLYYLNARYYDPSMGRFLNEDTYEGKISNPLSLNSYSYVSNNPLIYVDPTGHQECAGGSSCAIPGTVTADPGSWGGSWNSFAQYMKQVHSSWYTAIDYWSIGSLTDINNYYQISQENPYSLEQFLSAGMLIYETLPSGKVAKLTKKGEKFIDAAIKKCNCFVAGTKVQTDEGEKNIEDIEVGDKVLSKDEETGEVVYKKVTATFNHETDEIYKISVGNQTIESTYNHPFWVDGKGWTFVKDLKVGDLLVQSNGNKININSIKIVYKRITVYNMTVEDFHTYFVSDLGIWVHNTNCFIGGYINLNDAASHVQSTIRTIKRTGQAPQGYVGGRTFNNRGNNGEWKLPTTTTYKEYDVHPYQQGVNRGTERLVIGDDDGIVYYTNDHYKTFVKIK